MENFDRENIDELLEIRQIRQYFPPSKICAIRYILISVTGVHARSTTYVHCLQHNNIHIVYNAT